jgi:hypothetical protein
VTILNHNNSLSLDSQKRMEELQLEAALRIAALRKQGLRARELITQAQCMKESALRARISLCINQKMLSELSCQLFEILESKDSAEYMAD